MLVIQDKIRRRRLYEFEPHAIIAPGATRKLLPLQNGDLVRKPVLVMVDTINATFLDSVSGSEEESRAARRGCCFARR
jgi:hypothetical protein